MDPFKYLLKLNPAKIKMGLQRTHDLLKACGNPEKDLLSIQVVGTNGKGSTTAMVSNTYQYNGYKVGMFTSPHLSCLSERIRINGIAINRSSIKSFIDQYRKSIEMIDASFFEVMTVMAIWHFVKNRVDIAVLETGLGGRFDSVTAAKATCVLFTNVSLDHVEILGNSIQKIANEKIESIQTSTKFICTSFKEDWFLKKIKKKKKNFIVVKKNTADFNLNLKGDHQIKNANLALEACLAMSSILPLNRTKIIEGINITSFPGRGQIINKKPLIIFDVAHNQDSLEKYIDLIKRMHKGNKKILLIALQKRKNITNCIHKIVNTFDQIICTKIKSRNPMTIYEMKTIFKLYENKTQYFSHSSDAIEYAKKQINANDSLSIVGTHYWGPIINKYFKISFNKL
jgi:dihydrofolate synthase/folylpolyglutamate synthase